MTWLENKVIKNHFLVSVFWCFLEEKAYKYRIESHAYSPNENIGAIILSEIIKLNRTLNIQAENG